MQKEKNYILIKTPKEKEKLKEIKKQMKSEGKLNSSNFKSRNLEDIKNIESI